jgi:hypothetical protein
VCVYSKEKDPFTVHDFLEQHISKLRWVIHIYSSILRSYTAVAYMYTWAFGRFDCVYVRKVRYVCVMFIVNSLLEQHINKLRWAGAGARVRLCVMSGAGTLKRRNRQSRSGAV